MTKKRLDNARIDILHAHAKQLLDERNALCAVWWRFADHIQPGDRLLAAHSAQKERLWLTDDWYRRTTFFSMLRFVDEEEVSCQLRVGEIARQRAELEYLTERVEEQRTLLHGLSEEKRASASCSGI